MRFHRVWKSFFRHDSTLVPWSPVVFLVTFNLVEFDYTWFKKTLQIKVICKKSRWEKRWEHYWCQNNSVISPQTIIVCNFIWSSHNEIIESQSNNIALIRPWEKDNTYIFHHFLVARPVYIHGCKETWCIDIEILWFHPLLCLMTFYEFLRVIRIGHGIMINT